MATLITDPDLEERLLAQRRACGGDRYDEVWDGLYVTSPHPNDEHQELVMGFALVLHSVVASRGRGKVRPGVNVSDRDLDWTQNYRVPDVVVYLDTTTARNQGTHWVGGPDLAVEITSAGDRTREKLDFYARVGTREVLILEREPWSMELLRLRDGTLTSVGTSTIERSTILASDVVPLNFRLEGDPPRPAIVVDQVDGPGRWRI